MEAFKEIIIAGVTKHIFRILEKPVIFLQHAPVQYILFRIYSVASQIILIIYR